MLVGSFLIGYLLSTYVLFPAPDTAGTGIAVPDLYGSAREQAEGRLVEAGLTVGRTELLASSAVPEGHVIAQSPIEGQQLRPGAAVDLTLSAGPPELRVPPVAGLSAATARSLLEEAGFSVDVRQIPSEERAGVIAHTDPPAGTPATLPAAITVYVSAGPPQVDSILVPPGPGGTF